MTESELNNIFSVGETIAVEFKRCGNGIQSDVYQTVCSFLNRFGGDIFLGVLDNGEVEGIPEKSVPTLIKNFISCVGDSNLFNPTVYLAPEPLDYKGKKIIHIYVHPSSEVHSYKNVIYDRVDDADVQVTSTSAIAQMYIRKQNIFTEKKAYPYVKTEDLKLELLNTVKNLAATYNGGDHPWQKMDDMEVLKSAGLYTLNQETGKSGFNLAAVLLFGKSEVIKDLCPAYCTDAILRKVNIDRYDDRDYIDCNLIEAYDRLLEFGRKHLNDKFFIDSDMNRKSISGIILREMISNTLIHREYSSSFVAKFIIEKDRMYTENASRSTRAGLITPENLQPEPKNPTIANFFRITGRSDILGSGTRNLYRYSKIYSGEEPEIKEGDIFRITVPIDDLYEDKSNEIAPENENYAPQTALQVGISEITAPQNENSAPQNLTKSVAKTLQIIKENPTVTAREITTITGLSLRTIKEHFALLKKEGIIRHVGATKNGYWEVQK